LIAGICRWCQVGGKILIDDGLISLTVKEIIGKEKVTASGRAYPVSGRAAQDVGPLPQGFVCTWPLAVVQCLMGAARSGWQVVCVVNNNGKLGQKKGVNLPGVKVARPSSFSRGHVVQYRAARG